MDLKIDNILATGIKVIPVANEKLEGPISNHKTINEEYEILDYIVHEKGEYLTDALCLLSVGVLMEEHHLWQKYPDSNRIIFFICRQKK